MSKEKPIFYIRVNALHNCNQDNKIIDLNETLNINKMILALTNIVIIIKSKNRVNVSRKILDNKNK